MKLFGTGCALLVLFCLECVTGIASAQGIQAPAPEHEILKKDVGEWTSKMKVWGPGSDEPATSTGTETTKMIGELWSIGAYKGDVLGMEFTGRATLGFDPVKKKYVGTWIDSMSSHMTSMEGTYDETTETMTWLTSVTDPATGNPQIGKNVTKYYGDDRRVWTMYMEIPDMKEMFKTLEITYERKK